MSTRFWHFNNNQVTGPYDVGELAAAAGFGPDSLVCPEGRKGTQMGDWQRAEAVAELAESLLKTARVPAGAGGGVGSLLPSDPTLRDLAVLGTLQEKISQLESSLAQIQEEQRAREGELAGLKAESALRSSEAAAAREKLAELEAKLAAPPAAAPPGGGEAEGASSALKAELESLRTRLSDLQEAHGELKRRFEAAPPAAAAPAPEPLQAPPPSQIPSTRNPPPVEAAPSPLLFASAAPLPAAEPAVSLAELPGSPLSVPPAMEAPPVLEIPAPSASVQPLTGLESLGAPLAFEDPLPQTLVSQAPAPLDLPVPGAGPGPTPALEPMIPLGGDFLGSQKTPAPLKKEPPANMDFVDLTAQSGRKGGKLKWVLLLLLLAGGGGAAFLHRSGRLAPLLKGIGGAGSPAPAGEAPALPGSEPASTAAVGEPGAAADPAKEALELVKGAPVGGRTLAAVLEGSGPPPELSPWMVEKSGTDSFEVAFYPPGGGKNPKLRFSANLATRQVVGLDPASQEVLAGKSGPAARRARKSKGLLDEGGDTLIPSLSEETPPAAPPARKGRRKPRARGPSVSLEPELKTEAAPAKAPRPPKGGQEATLDELLLPGGSP